MEARPSGLTQHCDTLLRLLHAWEQHVHERLGFYPEGFRADVRFHVLMYLQSLRTTLRRDLQASENAIEKVTSGLHRSEGAAASVLQQTNVCNDDEVDKAAHASRLSALTGDSKLPEEDEIVTEEGLEQTACIRSPNSPYRGVEEPTVPSEAAGASSRRCCLVRVKP
jgi:hypothetical protein